MANFRSPYKISISMSLMTSQVSMVLRTPIRIMRDRCLACRRNWMHLQLTAKLRKFFFCRFPFRLKQHDARRIHLHFHHMWRSIRHVGVISRWLQPRASVHLRLLTRNPFSFSYFFSLFFSLDILLRRRCLTVTTLS